eukprot:196674-Rhodomonas_salina.1
MAAADLFLDTLTYNGHTTVSDALWTGLPVITCPGREWLSRVAASLLTVAGLKDLVAKDLSEYQQLAINLAQDQERLQRMRHSVQEGRASSPLFDSDGWASHFSDGLDMIWEHHARGAPLPNTLLVGAPPSPSAAPAPALGLPEADNPVPRTTPRDGVQPSLDS